MEIKNNNETKKALQLLSFGETKEYVFSKDIIEELHDYVIKEYGGSYGVRDMNLLDSVVKAPYQTGFGMDLYPTIIDKASKYLFDFAHYQIFIDGNKRTGLQTCISLLDINNIELNMTAEQQYFLVMDITKCIIDILIFKDKQ